MGIPNNLRPQTTTRTKNLVLLNIIKIKKISMMIVINSLYYANMYFFIL